MKDLVKATKAFSNETRLRILNILMARECCVCEVMQALDISQTRASRNLNVLYDAGFLNLRKDGLWSLYSVDPKSMDECLLNMTTALVKVLESNPVAVLDRERLQKAERLGLGCAESMRLEPTTG